MVDSQNQIHSDVAVLNKEDEVMEAQGSSARLVLTDPSASTCFSVVNSLIGHGRDPREPETEPRTLPPVPHTLPMSEQSHPPMKMDR